MKKLLYSIIALMFSATVFAQAPQSFKYQAVARNASGEVIANQKVGFQISILQGSESGTTVYTETHVDSTNQFGLVTLEIGTGTTTDDFTAIDWGNDTYFIQIEIDASGGTSYVLIGTSQLLSVPYSLHAKTAENLTGTVTEADPIYSASQAVNITVTDITNLNNLSGTNTGDQDLSGKVDKVTGKSLSTEDYTTAEKTKLVAISGTNSGDQDIAGITNNAQAIIDTASQIRADMPDVSGFISEEIDGSVTNELQTLTISGNSLTLSNSNSVELPSTSSSIPVYTTSEIVALTPSEGEDVYNSTDKLYQIFDGLVWQAFRSDCWPQPTIADAGPDQTFTDGTTTATLAANTPEAGYGTGLWTIVSGTGGSFTDATLPTTTFTGTDCTAYSLQWTISTSCNSSSSNVNIAFNQTPTTASAGSDQTFTDGTTTATLAANTPEAGYGTGLWTIVSGTGGSFTDATLPTTTFTGTDCTAYSLQWTISTSCNSSSSNVNIAFNQTPTTATAGSNQTFADGTTTATLAANTPEAEHGTGLWTIVSGTSGSFTDAASPTTTFTGELHGIYTLQWTITTNCSNSTDDVVIAFQQDGAGSALTDADGNSYNAVWIGNQLWMAENLKVTQEAGGTAIPTVSDDNSSGSTNDEWAALVDNDTDKAYCYYNNNASNEADTYGALYTYAAAKDACPTGWHLPTDAEWTELTNYIANDGHSGTEITALKSATGWSSSGNGTDDYGFTALPGGFRHYTNGTFDGVGYDGYWWSSTESSSSSAYSRRLYYSGTYVGGGYYGKSFGFSVRCVKD